MQRRRRPLGTALALFVLALAAGGSEFRGCGGTEAPEPGVTLPEATGGCVVDADCVSEDMCVALVCLRGTCVVSGVGIDDDGDSYAPAPCGMDCDDADPDVRPDAGERCDGVDEDCDGRIDEDATGIRTLAAPSEVVNATIVGVGEDYAVVGHLVDTVPGSTLAAYTVAPDGATSTPMLVGGWDTPIAFDLARDGDVLRVAAIAPSDGLPSVGTLIRSGDAWVTDEGPSPLGSEAAERIATLVFGGQQWVAFDVRTSGGLARRLWRSGDPAAVIDVGPVADDDAGPDLADDGTRVWVNAGAETLVAFDTDGAESARQSLPGRFGFGPLASGDAFVYVVYRDAFDHVLTRVTTEAFTTPITAPTGAATDRVSIFRAGRDVVVLRADDVGVRAWVLEEDLRAYRATFDPTQLGTIGVGPSRVGVAVTDGGVAAILSSQDDATVPAGLAVLACDSP